MKKSSRKKDNFIAKNGADKRILNFDLPLGIYVKFYIRHKGKDEVSNKFMDWLRPYNKEVKDAADLIRIIEIINKQCNSQVNDRTHIPPATLFKEEKEHLSPLPSKILLNSYISNIDTQIVPATLLVSYKGSKYSVP